VNKNFGRRAFFPMLHPSTGIATQGIRTGATQHLISRFSDKFSPVDSFASHDFSPIFD